jgi:hypothetical protein
MNSSPWIRSRTWDGFWMLSGFWVPTLFLPLAGVKPLVIVGTLLFWIGHRISSLYLVFCVGEYREVLQERRRYFLTFPLILFCGLAAFLLVPPSVVPLSLPARFVWLMFLDYFLSLYHFSSQHYGILSVYRGRLAHGQKDPGLLRWDWWACIGVSGILNIAMDYLNGDLDQFPIFDHAPLISQAAIHALRLALTALVLLAWGLTMRNYLRKRQSSARVLYFSSLCYLTIVSFYLEPLLYFFVVQMQHWLVSLGLTTHMAANSRFEPQENPHAFWYRPWAPCWCWCCFPSFSLRCWRPTISFSTILIRKYSPCRAFSPASKIPPGSTRWAGLRSSVPTCITFTTAALFAFRILSPVKSPYRCSSRL